MIHFPAIVYVFWFFFVNLWIYVCDEINCSVLFLTAMHSLFMANQTNLLGVNKFQFGSVSIVCYDFLSRAVASNAFSRSIDLLIWMACVILLNFSFSNYYLYLRFMQIIVAISRSVVWLFLCDCYGKQWHYFLVLPHS